MCEVVVLVLHSGQMKPNSPGFSSGFTRKIELHLELLHFAKCHLTVSLLAITISGCLFDHQTYKVIIIKSIEKIISIIDFSVKFVTLADISIYGSKINGYLS